VARVLIAVGGVLLVVGIALGGYQAYLRYQTAVQRQQVDGYSAAVQRPAEQAGRLVAQTIVPEIDAFVSGKLPASKVAIDAAIWKAFFTRTRQEFGRVARPDPVLGIASQFDKALAEYIQAVADLEQVAAASGAGRALATGQAEAHLADCDYGRAAVALTHLRRSLDLPDIGTFAAATTIGCK